VASHILAPGDDVVVGDYRLQVEFPTLPASESELPPPLDTSPLVGAADRVSLIPPPMGLPRIGVEQIDAITALELSLMSTARARDRCDKLARCLVDDFEATAVRVLRLHEDGTVLPLGEPRGASADALTGSLSGSVLARIWEERDTVAARTSRRQQSEVVAAGAGEAAEMLVVASPLANHEWYLDLVYVVLEGDRASDEGRSLVRLVATSFQQVEMVWQMRNQVRASAFVEHELETARNLQQRLIRLDSTFEDLEVVMGYQPCFDVGGDYVDALRLANGKVLLVIADVCGKGLQGALVASNLHALVRATVEKGETLTELVERMNRYLCRHLLEDSFVTLAALELDPMTGEVECVNAGHPAPFVVSNSGAVRQLQGCRNVALAIVDGNYSSERSRIDEDEVLLLYTDGYIDMLDSGRKPVGADRFGKAVARAVMRDRNDPVKALDAELRRTATEHRAGQLANDDFTFLIVRRRARDVSRVA
jgi:serine phosphatase RsbU (regulator of sigma subunit)